VIDLTSDDQAPDPLDQTKVQFWCLQVNYDKIYSAAAHNGETVTDAMNRALAFYQLITTLKVGQTAHWHDRDLVEHGLKILPRSYRVYRDRPDRPELVEKVRHLWRAWRCGKVGHRPVVAEGRGYSVCQHCHRLMRTKPDG
jgi:hypothetical protein